MVISAKRINQISEFIEYPTVDIHKMLGNLDPKSAKTFDEARDVFMAYNDDPRQVEAFYIWISFADSKTNKLVEIFNCASFNDSFEANLMKQILFCHVMLSIKNYEDANLVLTDVLLECRMCRSQQVMDKLFSVFVKDVKNIPDVKSVMFLLELAKEIDRPMSEISVLQRRWAELFTDTHDKVTKENASELLDKCPPDSEAQRILMQEIASLFPERK